jgi:uncharacterized protein
VKTLALMLALVGLVACGGTDHDPDRPLSTVTFEGADELLYVDVADEPEERSRGLMGVEHLPADEGMAFVFDQAVSSTFWMKDTVIPLSIAFIDDEGRVIGVLDMQPCEAEPCPSYGVDEPFVLAVEANIGWFHEHGIEAGDSAELGAMAYQ